MLRGCCPTLPRPPNQGQGWDPRWTWRVADRCLPHSRRTVQRSVQSRKKGGQQKVTMTQPRAGRPTPHLHPHPAYSQQLPLLPSIPRRPSSPSETADTGRRVSTVPGRLCVPRPSGTAASVVPALPAGSLCGWGGSAVCVQAFSREQTRLREASSACLARSSHCLG